jgi:hypothetical protein
VRRGLGPGVARWEWPPGAGPADGACVAGAAAGGRAPAPAQPVASMIAAAATAVAMTRRLITTTAYGAAGLTDLGNGRAWVCVHTDIHPSIAGPSLPVRRLADLAVPHLAARYCAGYVAWSNAPGGRLMDLASAVMTGEQRCAWCSGRGRRRHWRRRWGLAGLAAGPGTDGRDRWRRPVGFGHLAVLPAGARRSSWHWWRPRPESRQPGMPAPGGRDSQGPGLRGS